MQSQLNTDRLSSILLHHMIRNEIGGVRVTKFKVAVSIYAKIPAVA
jgi:hypothetical protein